MGGKVLAVSDAFGAIFNEQGLNIKALRKHIAEGKPLKEFPEGKNLPATLHFRHTLICQAHGRHTVYFERICINRNTTIEDI